MTDRLTDASVKELLDGATPGPWRADGEPWNRVVWSSAENRVCFMAHSNGLNDERDVATSNLAAAAPALARALLAARADTEAAVALALEELRHCIRESYQCGCMDAGCAGRHAERNSALEALSETLDALAPASGIAKLAELRAERDMWTETARLHLNAEQAFLSWLREAGEHMRAEGVTVCDDGVDSGDILAAKVAECAALLKADRDTLAAELAAANAREAGLRQAVTKYHLALDSRENGNTAGYRLQDEVQRILDMPWRQGAALAQSSTEVATNPSLCNNNGREGDQT